MGDNNDAFQLEGGRAIAPRTEGQQRYVEIIRRHDVVFVVGPAGTGKTYLAVAAALESLHAGDVNRIVLVRPAVEAGERLGFLPGDFREKINPYLRPLYDALQDGSARAVRGARRRRNPAAGVHARPAYAKATEGTGLHSSPLASDGGPAWAIMRGR